MAWTKLAIINEALSEIGLGGIIYDAMPEDRDHALARLDAMMANWKAKGINVQYLVVDNPDFDTINGNAGIPADLVRAVILNLAVDIAPSFGKVALPHTTTAARAAYDDALGSDLTPPIASYTLRAAPAGAGWKRDPYSILIPGGEPEPVPDVPVVPVDVDVTAGLTVTDEARVGQFVNDFARGQPVVIASTFLGLDGTGGGMIWEIGGGVAGAYAGFRENGTFILRAGNGAAPWSDETAYIGIPAGVIAGDGMLVCELVPNLPEVSVNVWWKGELVGSAESFAPYAIWAGADPGTYLFPVQEGDTAPVGEVSDRAATYTTATNLLIYGGQRITAATVPTAPLNLAATAGNRLVSLTWDAPADDGGLPVTSYLIERNVAGAGWLPLIQVAFVNGAPLAYDDATVSNGITYEYRVSAINGEGTGAASNVVSAVPVAVPSAPQNLTATAGNTQATLDWQAPTNDGGLAITGYQIERNDGAGWFVLGTVGDVLTFIDTGLTTGATYEYRVSAINSAGTGPASNAATVAIVTVPTAPQNLSATTGDRLVSLSWDAPASDGGLPVELYLVERNIAGAGWLPLIQLVFGPGTPLTYDDATVSNGVTYEYRVSATNDIGTSPPSNVVSATPITVPAAPTNLTATPGNTEVALDWQAPTNTGGSAITGYQIERNVAGAGWSVLGTVGDVLTFADTGLTNGVTYEYRVSAINAAGTGAASNVASAIPASQTHVFALVGQSNMVGRATFDGGAKWPAGTLQIARAGSLSGGTEGELVPAQHANDGPTVSRPLDHVDPQSGDMGLDIQFAIDYLAANPGVTLVFVPCADGGTGFSSGDWNKGDPLYENAVSRINSAMTANPSFQFQGFLWHQGERDTAIPGTYAGLLDQMIADMRADVTAAGATTPFILGGLGSNTPEKDAITAIIADTVNRVAYTAFSVASDLTLFDANHFDAASLRILGGRYNAAIASAVANVPTVPSAPQNLTATPGDTEVALAWQAPSDTGGTAVTGYQVERNIAGAGWSVLTTLGAVLSYTDTGLTNDIAHEYRVSAINAVGTGAASNVASATPAASGVSPEAGAAAHWLFGSDNPTYADLVSGQVATGPAQTLSAGFMTSPAGRAQGLDSGILESSQQTMCFAFRLAGAEDSIIGGTLMTGGDDTTSGVSPFTADLTDVRVNMRSGFGAQTVSTTAAASPDFVFVAVSKNTVSLDYVLFVGAQGGNEVLSGNSAQSTSPRNISIGNVHYDTDTLSGEISIAEAIIFNSSLTQAEIDAVYQRSRTRLTNRGLAVR